MITDINKVFILFEMTVNYSCLLKGVFKQQSKQFFNQFFNEGRRLSKVLNTAASDNGQDYNMQELIATYGEAFDRICKLNPTQLLKLNDTLDALSENRITIKKKKNEDNTTSST